MNPIASQPPPFRLSDAILREWNARNLVGQPIVYIDNQGRAIETILTAPAQTTSGARCARIAATGDKWCCIDRLVSR